MKSRFLLVGTGSLCLLLPTLGTAAGLDYPAQSTSGMGTVQANAAEANDATTVFYNPAGMARLSGVNVSQAGQLISAHGNFQNDGTTRADGQQTSGGNGGNFLPSLLAGGEFFASAAVNDAVSVGLGVFVPYGAKLNYGASSVERYFLDKADIETVNINPSISIRFDQKHSIGFGVSAEVIHVKLQSQADIASAALGIGENTLANISKNSALDATLINAAEAANKLNINVLAGGNALLNPTNTSLLGRLNSAINSTVALSPADQAAQQQAANYCASKYPSQATTSATYGRCLSAYSLTRPDAIGGTNGDGTLKVTGINVAAGYNLGYMYQYNDNIRFGLTYRSRIVHDISVDTNWDFTGVTGTVPDPNSTTALGALTGQRVNVKDYASVYARPSGTGSVRIVSPSTLAASLFDQLTPRLALMGTVSYVQTSSTQNLTIHFDDVTRPDGGCYGAATCYPGVTKQGDAVINNNFRDTWKVSIGANYQLTDKLMLRTGLGYEQTPVPDAAARYAGLPDNDRYIYSLGGRYTVRKGLSIDAAYSLILIKDSLANYTDSCAPAGYKPSNYKDSSGNNTNLNGYDVNGDGQIDDCTGNGGIYRGAYKDMMVNVLGLQVNQRF